MANREKKEMCIRDSYKLDNLCVIIDNNGLQIDGNVADVMNPYPIVDKLRAFGIETMEIDGHDFEQIEAAFYMARVTKGRPFAIVMKTVKGKGVSYMENQVGWQMCIRDRCAGKWRAVYPRRGLAGHGLLPSGKGRGRLGGAAGAAACLPRDGGIPGGALCFGCRRIPVSYTHLGGRATAEDIGDQGVSRRRVPVQGSQQSDRKIGAFEFVGVDRTQPHTGKELPASRFRHKTVPFSG